MEMEKELLGPCGELCEICPYYKSEKSPRCSGCGNQKGHMFYGDCRVYFCAEKHNVEHCGACAEFPCELLVGQFDPEAGPQSAFLRAGLLAYRKKHGITKYVEAAKKLRTGTNH